MPTKGSEKAQIAQEVAFARVLAGNDKTMRNRGVKKLRRWLIARGQGKHDFSEEECLRICTGLFYCMWMSDKMLIQEELAESIARLIHCFPNPNTAFLFIRTFHKVLVMEWQGLDQHRNDKFCMLVRRILRQSLEFCKRNGWNESVINKLSDVHNDTVLHPSTPVGFTLHFIDIYLEELAKVGQEKLDVDVVACAVEPFVKLLAATKDNRIRNEIHHFFKSLIQQTDMGIEYQEKFHAWRQQGFPCQDPGELELVSSDEEQSGEYDEEEEGEETIKENELDPRAGKVDVLLPQIPVDGKKLAHLFSKYLIAPNSTAKGKKLLMRLIDIFEKLEDGKFPFQFKATNLDSLKKRKKSSLKSAKELIKFEEKLQKGIDKLKKKVKVEQKRENETNNENFPPAKKKMKSKVEQKCENEANGENFPPAKKLKTGKKLKNDQKKIKSCKQKLPENKVVLPEPTGKMRKKKDEESEINDKSTLVENDEGSRKKGKKRKMSNNWQVDEINGNETISPKVAEVEKKSDNESLPAFWEKAKVKATKRKSTNNLVLNPFCEMEEKQPTTTCRRISFALEKNMAQENEEYLQEVRNSPKVPFDASRKPEQSALKPGLSPTPINPFYKFKKKMIL